MLKKEIRRRKYNGKIGKEENKMVRTWMRMEEET